MKVPKILVVDDDVLFTKALKMCLEGLGGYEVRVENDPRNALEAASEFLPQVVILDVIMPWLDGGEVAAKFARHPVLCAIPIIMLTALVTEDVTGPESLIQAGPMNILPKPVDSTLLLRCINDAVRSQVRVPSGPW